MTLRDKDNAGSYWNFWRRFLNCKSYERPILHGMKRIESREDIRSLVNNFYSKIRVDDLLGPIFNSHIAADEWPIHLRKLTDFWETNLFGIPKFKGSPSQKHTQVDKNLNYQIQPSHFEHWLKLWFETVDEMYTGDLAIKAKLSAQKMASGQFMVVWSRRPENTGKDS